MNAIVEVATAEVVAKTNEVKALVTRVFVQAVIAKVAASTLRVPTLGSHSISAVAPDHILRKELATAA